LSCTGDHTTITACIHGFDRSLALEDGIKLKTALVGGESQGRRVTVNSTSPFDTALLRWCLLNGLKIVQPLTLMSIGLYNDPSGAWLPSILF
jgi:hypothetical protein